MSVSPSSDSSSDSSSVPPPRRRRLGWLLAVVAVALLAVILYAAASPYLALRGLKQAVDARDAQAISRYVDYPALRISLKQQLTDELMRHIDLQRHDNPLAMLGAMVGSALIGPLVDAYATPEGVAALLSGLPPNGDPRQHPPALDRPAPPAAPPAPASGALAAPPATASAPLPGSATVPPAAPQSSAAYHGINEFVAVYQRNASGTRYAAIFRRSGLFGWKLSAIDLQP
ncbi:DUF2939 domain-containing protein [Burkholderia glumae]|uniref:DUF2939 domain-containing protein n=2 Tax=Burkholderia glumae TaxID=337 RepID=UPI0020374BA7|nr:DUF2939 domain-containing protein [Burkholderia glumae]MCM2493387.1 DUF2939 domain-containing protein [Burkholderia glumae]MCM2544027.1 DUF2939 domain-containing protein [Burkholderia glumae]